MRIDNYANILSSDKINAGDFISRLNPGDVIRAKVLEITSDEVVLKLFDGTVMRAGMLETMNAKAGDTVLLAVSSKLEGTIYLESVKKHSQIIESNPDTLKQLLETLQIKPDTQNLELAAEFVKAGAPVTAAQIKQASALLNSKPALDSEKVVFMILKGLDAESADAQLLSKLLEGDVKLGQQLKVIQSLLGQANLAGEDMGYTTPANTVLAEQADTAAVDQSNVTGLSQANAAEANAAQANATGTEENPVGVSVHIQSANIKNDPSPPIPVSGNYSAAKSDQTSDSLSDLSVIDRNMTEEAPQQSADIFASTDKAILGPESSISGKSDSIAALQTESGHKINETKQSESKTTERFSKLTEAVRDIFVKTDSEKLSSELSAKKINNDLNEKLELLKAAIQSSENLDSGTREGLSAATLQIEDTQRLLHQMNASNILYYQIPVNLAGHDTTAELYVMNRRQNKKKIDPNNTIMFISLDTVNMGRVEALLDIKSRNVTVNLRTENKQINEFIKTQIKDLYTGLAACGYKLAGVRYAVIDAASTPIQQERLLDGIARENYGKVDYRI